MAEGRTVKVERSRARGHVASNTLTVRPGAIQSRPRFCLGSRVDAHPNRSVLVNEKTRLLSVRFFEASAGYLQTVCDYVHLTRFGRSSWAPSNHCRSLCGAVTPFTWRSLRAGPRGCGWNDCSGSGEFPRRARRDADGLASAWKRDGKRIWAKNLREWIEDGFWATMNSSKSSWNKSRPNPVCGTTAKSCRRRRKPGRRSWFAKGSNN